jgi:hypothetical protein
LHETIHAEPVTNPFSSNFLKFLDALSEKDKEPVDIKHNLQAIFKKSDDNLKLVSTEKGQLQAINLKSHFEFTAGGENSKNLKMFAFLNHDKQSRMCLTAQSQTLIQMLLR